MDYSGNIVQELNNINNPLDCQTSCQVNPNCQFYSYSKSKQICWLMDIVGRKTSNPDKMSGPRTCPGIKTQ